MGRTPEFKVKSAGKKGWRLNIPASLSQSGKRQQIYRRTRELANAEAKVRRDNYKLYGEQKRDMSPGEADDAAEALILLKPFEVSLREAARYYVRQHDLKAKAPTLREAFKHSIKAKENILRPRSLKTLNQWLKCLPIELLDTNLVELEPLEITNALIDITSGLTRRESGLRVISSVIGDQLKLGTISQNPCRRVFLGIPKKEEEPVIYEVAELKTLLSACKNYPDGPDRNCAVCVVPFAFLAFAGVRPAELERLRWEEVSLENKNIRIGDAVSKTRKSRNIRLNPTLISWIETIPEVDRKGKVVPPRWIARAGRVRRETKLNAPKYQDALRHSYGSYKFAIDPNMDLLRADMGHSRKETFFNFYAKAVTPTAAKHYWEILPPPNQNPSLSAK